MIASWTEIYEHQEFGSIELLWEGVRPERVRLLSLQSEFFTPAEEIEACLEWAWNLQDEDMTRAGDGDESINRD